MTIIIDLPAISAGDVEWVAGDYTLYLDSGETLTGTPMVTCTGLTIASIAVSSTTLDILGKTVAIAKAIRFKVSGQTADTTYDILASVATTGGRTKVLTLRLPVAE